MGRLDDIDLTLSISRIEEADRLAAGQQRLLELRLALAGVLDTTTQPGPPVCLLFEGWDASGKGGAIRRVASRLDPRHVRVVQYGAPSPAELARHWLLRFTEPLPGAGGFTILDRSWYGRVLVERVEGLATEEQWRHAYDEIVGFEELLTESGMCIVKFWMHISPDEQLKRFEKREQEPLKRWKLTDEDWRNRERWTEYAAAAEEMFERTDRAHAPWKIVAADSKRYARVTVLETVISEIESAMRRQGFEPPPLLS